MQPQPVLDTLVIDMYAALESNPVTVSYPDGQIAANDKNILSYTYDNNFITIYTFGPYRLAHHDVSRKTEHFNGYDEELVFTKPGTTLYIPVQIGKFTREFKKDYIELYQAIKAKASSKPFTNPYVERANDAVYFLQKYMLEAPKELLDGQDKDNLLKQLDNIRTLILKGQNAITK